MTIALLNTFCHQFETLKIAILYHIVKISVNFLLNTQELFLNGPNQLRFVLPIFKPCDHTLGGLGIILPTAFLTQFA